LLNIAESIFTSAIYICLQLPWHFLLLQTRASHLTASMFPTVSEPSFLLSLHEEWRHCATSVVSFSSLSSLYNHPQHSNSKIALHQHHQLFNITKVRSDM
jgi:hypothetical protein